MPIGRKVGWSLSKKVLYRYDLSLNVVLIIACAWAIFVFASDVALIYLFQPHWVIKWIFGYALGTYVSSPNFGLVYESVFKYGNEIEQERHEMIKNIPQALFILVVVIYEAVMYFL